MPDIDPLSVDFARQHPEEFARVLGRGELLDIMRVLKQLPASVAASIVARLHSSRVNAVLTSSQDITSVWLSDASYDDAISLLGQMPREHCLALINSLANRKRRRRLLQFLKYPTHSVGALVSDVLVRLSADTAATDALRELRARNSGDPGPIVVLQPDGRYLGILDLWLLISRDPPSGPVRDYVAQIPALLPETSVANAALDTNWYLHNWLPVVDHEHRVLGGVSRDRLFGSASRTAERSQSGRDLFTSLTTEMVYVLGALLDRILNRPAES